MEEKGAEAKRRPGQQVLCWGRVLEAHPPLVPLLVLSPPSPLLCLELVDATTGTHAAQPRGHCMDSVTPPPLSRGFSPRSHNTRDPRGLRDRADGGH